MITLDVTNDERVRGGLSPEHREAAVQSIWDDGFVVLNDAVNLAHLDILHARMLEDVELLRQRKDAPFNWNVGNIQQDPPPFPPYLFADVLLNDLVIDVTAALLGEGVRNVFYSGNTAMPGPHRQPVHADTGHLWPRLDVAHPPSHLVVNIPTVDVSPENGSTEIWPGTHFDLTITSGKDIKVPAEALDARRALIPPIQPSFRRGGVLIRDIRLWHAGMPNRTDAPRPMIAMIHTAGWLDTKDFPALRFPVGTEEFFRASRLHTHARFVSEPIDHIAAPTAYEYEAEGKAT